MKVYVLLDLTTEDRRRPVEEVADELEVELDGMAFDVEESGYEVTILGIGKNPADLAESIKARRRQMKL